MSLSAAGAAVYEVAGKAAAEQAVVESTRLIEVALLPLIPWSITEVETTEEGRFADFILGNGHMLLLHPAGEDGYSLVEGDTVTVMLDADGECRLQFRVYREGRPIAEEESRAGHHRFQFTVEDGGRYNFSVMHESSDPHIFTNCSIAVN